ncbi:hypothetical protein AACH06_21145 [Ideonella sp. DXS29W]|uniref:Secreted protein n=1 Tax=Ideonella lacteola TaxID=2984193 RepID=A0ABU9BXL4_9BURK
MHPLPARFRHRTRWALTLLGGLVASTCTTAFAQTAGVPDRGSSMESAACRQALAEVKAQEAALLEARRRAAPQAGAPAAASAPVGQGSSATPPAEALIGLRERAARLCLGPGTSGPARSQRTVQTPITVPSASPPRGLLTPTAPPPTTTEPVVPLRSEPMVTIVGCDATGCWASDGTRLQRSGPQLIGPRGACTLQGAVLRCPP